MPTNENIDDRHPLTETLHRLSSLDDNLHTDTGPAAPGFLPAADLLDNTNPALEDALDRYIAQYPTIEPRTKASFFIGDYAWYVSAAAVAAYLTERRAPDLSAGNIAIRFRTYTWHEDGESGEAERLDVRYLSGCFGCLPSDPAASHPDAVVLPNEAALLAWMRGRLEAHLTPLIAHVVEITRLSDNAQWQLVADACEAQFLNTGKANANAERAQADGLAFVKDDKSPLSNPQTGYFTLTANGHTDTFRARGGCCRYYTISETGDDYCSTCVLRKPEERDARLLAYMLKKYGVSRSPNDTAGG